MSRAEEVKRVVEFMNNKVATDEDFFIALVLTDIAQSLAIIADEKIRENNPQSLWDRWKDA